MGVLALCCARCAKVSMPVGGPKDTTPPKMVAEMPLSGNCNFTAKQIKITFDEFFTLNNPNANVLISPPLNKQPEYTLRDKSLIIRFKDTLRPNTTYNMLFSDCIQDFHEGNKLNFYHYCFSTGPQIDNYMLQGSVQDARMMESESGYFVMLYRGTADSLPLTTLPDYVTKSVTDGSFLFSNITPGNYQVFALKDINSNLLYDLPEESVAFCDSPQSAFQAPPKDSTGRMPGLDSLHRMILRSFVASGQQPKLLRYENPAPGVYKFPYKSSFNSFSATFPYRKMDFFQQINASSDTVTWYAKSTPVDTFTVVLCSDDQRDTVLVKPQKAKAGRGMVEEKSTLSVKAADVGHFYKPMRLLFSYPVRPADSVQVFVCTSKDTQSVYCSVPDSFVIQLPLQLPDLKKYAVIIPDSSFWGYDGQTHGQLRFDVQRKTEKDYGNLIVNFFLPEDSVGYYAELWKGNSVIERHRLLASCKMEYPMLEPGAYKLSVYRDDNGNGRWDVGDYAQKRLPERVFWFPLEITIRAFWDDEELFDLTR